MIKHATAGAFVFCRFPDEWRLGLIEHPRLGRWMVPGGHVEPDESQAQAAVREVEEESGLVGVRLLEVPSPSFPEGFPVSYARVPLPWWITEQSVGPDNHLSEAHVHVDHQYVAVVPAPDQAAAAAHSFAWYTADEVPELRMFEDSKLLAKVLFASIEDLDAGRWADVDVLRPYASTLT